MSIDISRRTITEKTTSVEDPIELSQKGTVSVVHISGRAPGVLAVPTNIPKPKSVTLIPMNSLTAKVLQRWYCNYNLYPVTEATMAKLLAKSATAASLASGLTDVLVSYNGKLYISDSTTTIGSSQLASASLITASDSLFKKVPWIASAEAKLLAINFQGIATIASLSKAELRYSYEVRGY